MTAVMERDCATCAHEAVIGTAPPCVDCHNFELWTDAEDEEGST